MVIDTAPHKEKEFFTCRSLARELGVSSALISMAGRCQKWPGATGNRWKIPAKHVQKLKTQLKKGGSLL